MHEAMFYEKLIDQRVRCNLCPNFCVIGNGSAGRCRGRKNIDGILYATNYGATISLALDPIEKKPLYHYYPGSMILSLGANSCNLSCFFCQNFQISQYSIPTSEISPTALLKYLIDNQLNRVAFTYTEPLTWLEYILDFGSLSRHLEIDIVLVTNGYINPEPLLTILPVISAMNIDLKAYDPEFYINSCLGQLEPVLGTIETAFESGVHIELTNLIIPGLNDTERHFSALTSFVAGVSKDIPLHFSRYHPAYRSKIFATPLSTIEQACKNASKELNYVYAGNCHIPDFIDTICPKCKRILIQRSNYQPRSHIVSSHPNPSDNPTGICPSCKQEIYGRYFS